MKKRYNEKQLLELANKHKEALKSVRYWDKYAQDNNLPRSTTLIKEFGSWTNLKKLLNLPLVQQERKRVYTKEIIINILKENKEHFLSQKAWNEYAKENKLPLYPTISRYLKYEEIIDITGVANKPHSKEELITIAKENCEQFTTMDNWDQFARKNKLPSSFTYARKFKSWSYAKRLVRR